MKPATHRTPAAFRAAALCLLTALASRAPAQPAASPIATIESDSEVLAPEGHTAIEWSSNAELPVFELERASAADFQGAELWYTGPATQSFVSGLEDGTHYYRVRAKEGERGEWGPWSAPVAVTVEHQSMALAWPLFTTGAFLFVAIVAFVVVLSIRTAERSARDE